MIDHQSDYSSIHRSRPMLLDPYNVHVFKSAQYHVSLAKSLVIIVTYAWG